MTLYRRIYLLITGLALCMVAACNPNAADLPVAQPPIGQVAYLNLIPGGNPIDFYVNGTRINSNKIAYSEYSGYISVLSGERSLLFKTDSLRNNVFDPVTVTLPTDYTTIFVTGSSAANVIYARDTAIVDITNYKPKMRFINASANSPAYDVYFKTTAINNTAAKKISAFTRVDTGKVAINVKLTGSSTVLLTDTLRLSSNKVYTFFVYGPYTATAKSLKFGVIVNH